MELLKPLLVEKWSGSTWRGFETFESFETAGEWLTFIRVYDHDRGTRMAINRYRRRPRKLLEPISEHFPPLVWSKVLFGNGSACERLRFAYTPCNRYDPYINDLKIVFFIVVGMHKMIFSRPKIRFVSIEIQKMLFDFAFFFFIILSLSFFSDKQSLSINFDWPSQKSIFFFISYLCRILKFYIRAYN